MTRWRILLRPLETSENLKGVGVVLQGYNSAEKYELVKRTDRTTFERNVRNTERYR